MCSCKLAAKAKRGSEISHELEAARGLASSAEAGKQTGMCTPTQTSRPYRYPETAPAERRWRQFQCEDGSAVTPPIEQQQSPFESERPACKRFSFRALTCNSVLRQDRPGPRSISILRPRRSIRLHWRPSQMPDRSPRGPTLFTGLVATSEERC